MLKVNLQRAIWPTASSFRVGGKSGQRREPRKLTAWRFKRNFKSEESAAERKTALSLAR